MRLLTSLLVACALVAAGPALAGKKNKTNGKANQPSTVEKILTKAIIGALITVAERAIIGDYVDSHRGQFAGAEALPPGIAKKMPPGGLLARLPARPGQEWRVVGTDLLIIQIATGAIVDVLKNAL